MPIYITLMKLTDSGTRDIKSAPYRMESTMKAWEMMGGKVLGAYLVMGEYDYVIIAEAPSDEAAAVSNLTLNARECVRTNTLRAFTMGDFAEMAKKLP